VSGANSTSPQGGPGAAGAASGLFLRRADGKQKDARITAIRFVLSPDAFVLAGAAVMMCDGVAPQQSTVLELERTSGFPCRAAHEHKWTGS
jgi:hypothetical protein